MDKKETLRQLNLAANEYDRGIDTLVSVMTRLERCAPPSYIDDAVELVKTAKTRHLQLKSLIHWFKSGEE